MEEHQLLEQKPYMLLEAQQMYLEESTPYR